MICPLCQRAADAATRYSNRPGEIRQPHDPEVCIDAGRTPEDIRLHGAKCPCQHGQRNATEGSGTQHG